MIEKKYPQYAVPQYEAPGFLHIKWCNYEETYNVRWEYCHCEYAYLYDSPARSDCERFIEAIAEKLNAGLTMEEAYASWLNQWAEEDQERRGEK